MGKTFLMIIGGNVMISTTGVSLRYGGRKLFEDVNIKFTEGNCYGLIGENGAGKSTWLKLLAGHLKPTDGEIQIFGKDNIDNEREIKERIGFVYDECFYYENLSIKNCPH